MEDGEGDDDGGAHIGSAIGVFPNEAPEDQPNVSTNSSVLSFDQMEPPPCHDVPVYRTWVKEPETSLFGGSDNDADDETPIPNLPTSSSSSSSSEAASLSDTASTATSSSSSEPELFSRAFFPPPRLPRIVPSGGGRSNSVEDDDFDQEQLIDLELRRKASPFPVQRSTVEQKDAEILRTRGCFCLCCWKCISSLFSCLVGLLSVTIVGFVAATVVWSVVYGRETHQRRSIEHSSDFVMNVKTTRSTLDGMIESVAYADSLTHGDALLNLLSDLPESNMTLIRTWSALTVGALKGLSDSRFGFGVNIAFSPTSEVAIWYAAGPMQISNISGDGITHAYRLNSLESAAAGEPFGLEEIYQYELSPTGDEIPEIHSGKFLKPKIGIGLWGCGFFFQGCQVFVTHGRSRILEPEMGIVANFRVSALTSIFSDVQAKCCLRHACTRAWIYDIENDGLIGVSEVSNMDDLVHPNFALNRLKTPAEFGDALIESASQRGMELLQQGVFSGTTGVKAVVREKIGAHHDVMIGFLNYSEYDGRFLVFQAVRTSYWEVAPVVTIAAVIFFGLMIIGALWFFLVLCGILRPIKALVDGLKRSLQKRTVVVGELVRVKPWCREIQALQDEFFVMRNLLSEWAKFLPQIEIESGVVPPSSPSNNGVGTLSISSTQSGGGGGGGGGGGIVYHHQQVHPPPVEPLFKKGMTSFDGTFVVLLCERVPSKLRDAVLFEMLVQCVDVLATRNEGVVVEFSLTDRRVVIGFGITGSESLQMEHASTFAISVKKSLRIAQIGISFTVGLAQGRMFHGMLGTRTQKIEAFNGEALDEALRFAKLATQKDRILGGICLIRQFKKEKVMKHLLRPDTIVPCAIDLLYDANTGQLTELVTLVEQNNADHEGLVWKNRRKLHDSTNVAFRYLATNRVSKCREECRKFTTRKKFLRCESLSYAMLLLRTLESLCVLINHECNSSVVEYLEERLRLKRAQCGLFVPNTVRLFDEIEEEEKKEEQETEQGPSTSTSASRSFTITDN